MVRSKEGGILFGQMAPSTMESSMTITLRGLAYIVGLMADHLRELGRITKCTAKASSAGLTVESSLESTLTTKSTVTAPSSGEQLSSLYVYNESS